MVEAKYFDTYNWMAEQAATLPMQRVMFQCKNKQCNHRWARDYAVVAQKPLLKDLLYRVSPLAIMMLQDDKHCPKCGCDWVKSNEVVGTVVESKPCNDSCLNAASSICRCSCGGKHHGNGILI